MPSLNPFFTASRSISWPERGYLPRYLRDGVHVIVSCSAQTEAPQNLIIRWTVESNEASSSFTESVFDKGEIGGLFCPPATEAAAAFLASADDGALRGLEEAIVFRRRSATRAY